MAETFLDSLKRYAKLIDDIAVDCLRDLKSLRVWLVLWAYIFNGAILYLVGFKGVDYKLAGIGIALLTACYTYFFASKHQEAKMNNENQQIQNTASKEDIN